MIHSQIKDEMIFKGNTTKTLALKGAYIMKAKK